MGIGDIIDVSRGVDIKHEDKLLVGLNPEQREAVLHEEGPKLLVAVAGAGKTRVVVHRIARLVKVKGVHPGRILAVTFSKKGADEMNERLKNLIGETDARVGTFHSVALEIHRSECLGSFGSEWDWTIDSKDRFRVVLKEVTGYKHMNWKKADVTALATYIETCKSNMARPNSDEAIEIAEGIYAKYPGPKHNPALLHEAYERAEEIRRERRLLTFADMLIDSVEAMVDNEDIRLRWAARWDWVIQDEAQDQSLPQLMMGSLLAQDHRNYVLVGDPAQCHPPGTMIATDDGDVSIEDLWADQEGKLITVKGWNRKAQKMVGGRRASLGSRVYDGRLFDMRVCDRSTEMTDNHKVLCRWTNRDDHDTCVTYLMYRKDLGYRVGWCQLLASRGKSRNLHLVTRAKLEKADKVWILKTHKTRREASIHESIVAAKHGIPTATFEPVSNTHLDTAAIPEIFGSVNTWSRGPQVLAKYSRSVDFPFWPFPATEADDPNADYVRGTYFPVHAINLLPGLMSVPLPDDRNMWAPIDAVPSRMYSGLVYSLDVEKDHSYAANGIVVLNCIYTWRGARPEKLLGFEKDWSASVVKMGRNYRCGSKIIDAANRSLAAMDPTTRLDLDMICERDTEGTVTSTEFMNLEDEGESVAHRIATLVANAGVEPRDIAILYRTNAQSRAPEEGLIGHRIPYRILGGTSFYERREVKNLLGYLRVASGHGKFVDWLDSMEKCINSPFRFLGKRYVEKVREVAKMHARRAKSEGTRFSWLAVVKEANERAGIQRRQRYAAEDWASMIENLRAEIQAGAAEGASAEARDAAFPARILDSIVTQTRYTQWLIRDEGEESTENSRVSNVREMVRAAGRFPTVRELLDYVDRTIRASREKRGKKDPNKVTLCSIHRSKGLEWPVVIVIGCAHGILPHGRAEDPEEERRLFYVASTRAKDELHYSYAINVAVGNRVVQLPPSDYLDEVGHSPIPGVVPPPAEFSLTSH